MYNVCVLQLVKQNEAKYNWKFLYILQIFLLMGTLSEDWCAATFRELSSANQFYLLIASVLYNLFHIFYRHDLPLAFFLSKKPSNIVWRILSCLFRTCPIQLVCLSVNEHQRHGMFPFLTEFLHFVTLSTHEILSNHVTALYFEGCKL